VKFRAIVIAALLALVASVSGLMMQASAITTAESSASQIVADMGAGWNLGNQFEANNNGYPSETAWGQPTVTQALLGQGEGGRVQNDQDPGLLFEGHRARPGLHDRFLLAEPGPAGR